MKPMYSFCPAKWQVCPHLRFLLDSVIQRFAINQICPIFRFMNKAVTDNFHASPTASQAYVNIAVSSVSNITCGMVCIVNSSFPIQRFLRSDAAVSLTLQTDTASISLCMKISTMCHVFRFSRTPRKLYAFIWEKHTLACDAVGQVVPLYRHTTIYLLGTHSRDPCK